MEEQQHRYWQESETLEFKTSLAGKEDAGADLCAFANKIGGVIYIGVKNGGENVGIQDANEKTIRGLAQFYRDNTQPTLYPKITIEEKNEKKLIKIEVEKSDTPYHTFKNIPYIRMASSSPQMKQDEYQRRLVRYQGLNSDYSAKLISGTNINDLSVQAIQELRRLFIKSNRFSQDISHLDDLNLLKNLQLIQNNTITVAALVLLGTEESLAKYLPYAEIRYGYRLSESEGRNQDMVIFKGGYLLYYNSLWEKINSRNITLNIPNGLFLTEKKAFEEDTIREAVNNAVMHRDYQSAETIFIFQYPTNFEIKNPGGFIEGIDINNILTESKVRNKLVADILYRCEFVEQFGTGVNLMFKNQLSLGKNPPDYSKSDNHRVDLKLDGNIQDIEFAKYVLKVADDKQKLLSDNELILLYKIKQGKTVSTDDVKSMAEMGLIEKIGRGKWMLAKKYYIDTNQKGKYTHQKGLDTNTNKALILTHLKDFPGGSRKEDLQRVLPSLSWIQIWWLLKQLRKDGKVVYTGDRRSKKGVYKLKENI